KQKPGAGSGLECGNEKPMPFPRAAYAVAALILPVSAFADTGDPQVKTDHPWYPGELSCSTFERLLASQAELYTRVTGRAPVGDEDKALASWFWRNTHYWHGEEGAEDLWGRGFTQGDLRTREYWTGLFAHGFGLCGTTHSQWTAEMNALLGHVRGRAVGVEGHNSFEAFLTGGPYGAGKWVLLDHDISTVIFDEKGEALLSIAEVMRDPRRFGDRRFRPERQRGWLVAGLHPEDAKGVYTRFATAEYLSGYAGPPPLVRLKRGETFRRYLQPGLEDGKTFVFWGRNYNSGGIPGPERSLTWVNQPELMYGSRTGSPYRVGQARFANAVYVYRPDFARGDYKEGVVEESDRQVTFEFVSPYIIAATPPNAEPWGVYSPGGQNGLVLRGRASCSVEVSVDLGATWRSAGTFRDGMDLTDLVKGHRQYLLRLGASARELAGSGLTITTVCQANSSVLPRLKDGRHSRDVRSLRSGPGLGGAHPPAGPGATRGGFLPLAARHPGGFDAPRGTHRSDLRGGPGGFRQSSRSARGLFHRVFDGWGPRLEAASGRLEDPPAGGGTAGFLVPEFLLGMCGSFRDGPSLGSGPIPQYRRASLSSNRSARGLRGRPGSGPRHFRLDGGSGPSARLARLRGGRTARVGSSDGKERGDALGRVRTGGRPMR
ncbi:MAG: hypothetical protein ACK44W_08840, partial [Planctomycetota bacterium]